MKYVSHSPFTNGNTIIQCNYDADNAAFYRFQCNDKEEQIHDVKRFDDVVAVWSIKPRNHAKHSCLAVNSNGDIQTTNTLD